MAKVIEFDLSKEGLDRAIKEIEQFQKELVEKMAEVRRQFAQRIVWSADAGFANAVVSDVIKGSAEPNDVTVRMEHNGDVTLVIADGSQAVFIEFGAGVYHNGPVGQSLNPWVSGADNGSPDVSGFTIGSYGKGKGERTAWGYYDSGNNVVVTRGTFAQRPMYNGYKLAVAELASIVRGVFR